jgi:hypothetical protein
MEIPPARHTAAQAGKGFPFGFAQGRLSTAVVVRIREAQPTLRMTKSGMKEFG